MDSTQGDDVMAPWQPVDIPGATQEAQSSREWFVYSNTTYYPYAEIVTADTPEKAAEIVCGSDNAYGAVVFPADALAHATTDRIVQTLRDEGDFHREMNEPG
jgi:hypothetical protein